MLLIVLVLLVRELVRFELEKRKVSKKRVELSKIKAKIYAENKRLQFEEYREYIENKYKVCLSVLYQILPKYYYNTC